MDKSESKLAPCPWCNGANIKVHLYSEHVDGEPDAFCQCHDCSVIGPNGTDEDSAIAAWNTRAAPTSAEQEREAELPPLPPINIHPVLFTSEQAYTADQMRDYARAAFAALKQPALKQPALTDAQILKIARTQTNSEWVYLHDDVLLRIARAVLAAAQEK